MELPLENLLKNTLPMKRLLEPDDLQVLIDNSEDMDVIVEWGAEELFARAPREGIETPLNQSAAGAAIRSEQSKPVEDRVAHAAPAVAGELPLSQEDDEESDDIPVRVAWMSNAHIMEMVIHVLGPRNVAASISTLRSIKMANDPVFSKCGTVTNYVRAWKVAIKWCKNHIPVSKVLKKHFLDGVKPYKFKQNLENIGIKTIDKLMKTFVNEYRARVDATLLLQGMNVLSAEAKDKPSGEPNARADKNKKPEKEKADKKDGVVTQEIRCYHCDEIGHKRPIFKRKGKR